MTSAFYIAKLEELMDRVQHEIDYDIEALVQ